jgi:hypothetical protein
MKGRENVLRTYTTPGVLLVERRCCQGSGPAVDAASITGGCLSSADGVFHLQDIIPTLAEKS